MELLTPQIAFLVPLITALVGICTRLGLSKKFAPLAAILVGVVLNLLGSFAGEGSLQIIMFGIVGGLASSGLFDLAIKPLVSKK